MELTINWGEPVLPEEKVDLLQTTDLDDFYVKTNDFDKTNLFFILLTSFHYYLDQGKKQMAAKLSFLMAYYLYIPLTPPGSWELTQHYMEQAVALDPLPEYLQWREWMKESN